MQANESEVLKIVIPLVLKYRNIFNKSDAVLVLLKRAIYADISDLLLVENDDGWNTLTQQSKEKNQEKYKAYCQIRDEFSHEDYTKAEVAAFKFCQMLQGEKSLDLIAFFKTFMLIAEKSSNFSQMSQLLDNFDYNSTQRLRGLIELGKILKKREGVERLTVAEKIIATVVKYKKKLPIEAIKNLINSDDKLWNEQIQKYQKLLEGNSDSDSPGDYM